MKYLFSRHFSLMTVYVVSVTYRYEKRMPAWTISRHEIN
jgi:hypothetical protein